MRYKYKNAPLIYVTAAIRTSALPKLTKDQTANIEQNFLKKGFVHTAHGISTTIKIEQLQAAGAKEEPKISDILREETRKAFFSEDRTICLIIGTHGFEWRTSSYTDYQGFHESFTELLKVFTSLVDSFESVVIEELTLSYSDIIVPLKGRKLSDYFANDGHILPLSFFEKFDDLQKSGIVQVSRVTKPTEKINILLEQLPTSDGKVTKLVPEVMLEPDNNFAMPIRVKDDWRKDNDDRENYALLLTQASSLVSSKLGGFFDSDVFESIHQLTSDTFKSIINHEVCDIDWQKAKYE